MSVAETKVADLLLFNRWQIPQFPHILAMILRVYLEWVWNHSVLQFRDIWMDLFKCGTWRKLLSRHGLITTKSSHSELCGLVNRYFEKLKNLKPQKYQLSPNTLVGDLTTDELIKLSQRVGCPAAHEAQSSSITNYMWDPTLFRFSVFVLCLQTNLVLT